MHNRKSTQTFRIVQANSCGSLYDIGARSIICITVFLHYNTDAKLAIQMWLRGWCCAEQLLLTRSRKMTLTLNYHSAVERPPGGLETRVLLLRGDRSSTWSPATRHYCTHAQKKNKLKQCTNIYIKAVVSDNYSA